MDRRLVRLARLLGAFIGTFAGIVAVQFMRLRRMEFLPMHPGFYVNHVVEPTACATVVSSREPPPPEFARGVRDCARRSSTHRRPAGAFPR